MFNKRLAAIATFGTVSLLSAVGLAQTNSPSAEPAAPVDDNKKLQSTEKADSPQPEQKPAQSAEQSSQATGNGLATTASTIPPAAPVAAAPRAPETNVAPVAPAPPEPERKEATQPILPNKLYIGKESWLQVGALLQGWYDTRWNSDIPEGASRNTQSSFRVRRAEVKVTGELLGGAASFLIAFDPAATYKFDSARYTVADGQVTSAGANTASAQTITTYTPPGNTAALKLFWVSLKSPYVDAAIGQFKDPISFEGQTSSSELLFPERAYSTRYFGDSYDMGVRLEKKLDWFKYQAFLLNGAGQNQLDKNLQKDLVIRFEVTPIEGITLGASGLTSLGQRADQTTTKDTGTLFGRLNKAGVLVQGELIWGELGRTASGQERTKAAGRYAAVGYTISGKLQPIVRLGYLNTDKTVTAGRASSYALYAPFGVASDEVRSYEFGLNYYLQGHSLKLQAAYGFFNFDNVPALQQFTLAAQAAL